MTRPRLTVHPGGGGIPGQLRPNSAIRNLRPLHPEPETRVVFLNALEVSLCINTLRKSPSQAVRDLAEDISLQWSRPGHPSMQPADACDPHGIPRPGGAS